ncbi:DUF1330 domain-containing protein [Hyphomonas sp.]|uniref:DUF1330 domain-containing protein n=1 Tax=Hyphomonas sp. TaxID=87 RepID=UPI0030FBF3F0
MTAYLILDFTILDMSAFRQYIDAVPAFIAKHGGRYIVRGVEPEVMEGDWKPERVVILEFPAAENARAFLDDPDFQDLIAVRKNATISKLILAEGCL